MPLQRNESPIKLVTNVFSYQQAMEINDFFTGWTGVAVEKICQDVAIQEYFASVKVKGTKENKPLPNEHWFNRLIDTPNMIDKMTWYDTLSMALKWLFYQGNAYLWFNPNGYTENGKSIPTQIWVLPADYRTILVADNNGMVHTYLHSTNLGMLLIPANEVVHIKTMKPDKIYERNFFIGSPTRFMIAIDAMQTDKEIKTFLRRQFKKNLVTPFVVYAPPGTDLESPEYIEQLIQNIKDKDIGREISMVLGEGQKLEAIPTGNLTDEAIKAMFNADENRKLIVSAMGLPGVGLIDSTANQNVGTADRDYNMYMKDCVMANCKIIERAINIYTSQIDGTNLSHIEYESSDDDKELKWYTFYFENGIMNADEILELKKMPPTKNGNGQNYFIKNNLLPLESVLNPPTPPAVTPVLTEPKPEAIPEPEKKTLIS